MLILMKYSFTYCNIENATTRLWGDTRYCSDCIRGYITRSITNCNSHFTLINHIELLTLYKMNNIAYVLLTYYHTHIINHIHVLTGIVIAAFDPTW